MLCWVFNTYPFIYSFVDWFVYSFWCRYDVYMSVTSHSCNNQLSCRLFYAQVFFLFSFFCLIYCHLRCWHLHDSFSQILCSFPCFFQTLFIIVLQKECKLLLDRPSSARPSPKAKCRYKNCITTQGIPYAKEQIYLTWVGARGRVLVWLCQCLGIYLNNTATFTS